MGRGIELCARRSTDSLGGFGSGLRDDTDRLGVWVDIDTFGGCSEESKTSRGDCCDSRGEGMLDVVGWSSLGGISGLGDDDVLDVPRLGLASCESREKTGGIVRVSFVTK